MTIEYHPRVVSDLMQSYFGKGVILLGRVASVDPSGKKVCLKDCTGQNVFAYLKQPLSGPLELDTWCEIEGRVKGKGHMDVERFDQLPASLFENFDQDAYVQAIKLLITPGTSNNYVVEDKGEHHGEGPDVELVANAGDGRSDLDGMGAEESFLNL